MGQCRTSHVSTWRIRAAKAIKSGQPAGRMMYEVLEDARTHVTSCLCRFQWRGMAQHTPLLVFVLFASIGECCCTLGLLSAAAWQLAAVVMPLQTLCGYRYSHIHIHTNSISWVVFYSEGLHFCRGRAAVTWMGCCNGRHDLQGGASQKG